MATVAPQLDRRRSREQQSDEPPNPQAKKLEALTHEVDRTQAAFDAAQRAREAHQRLLTEMVEETLRVIAKTRGHGQQKCKHVRDSTTSYVARFEHEMTTLRENFRHELEDRSARIEATFEGLESRTAALEADLEAQREIRKKLIEEKLGPIRDEEKRILAALDSEQRARRLQEERREKMLQDEMEAIAILIDKEKFERELQGHDFDRMVAELQHKLEKRMYQAEKERQDTVEQIKEVIAEEAADRVEKQHRVIESIATFVKRYRGQVYKELEVSKLPAADAGSTLGLSPSFPPSRQVSY
jgi:hypothetical protein